MDMLRGIFSQAIVAESESLLGSDLFLAGLLLHSRLDWLVSLNFHECIFLVTPRLDGRLCEQVLGLADDRVVEDRAPLGQLD
jgi:hypothetical protein